MTSKPKVHSIYVPSDGPKYTDIMFVGEAPGKVEEGEGKPFVGRAGDVVNSYMLDRCGLKREHIYYTNLAKYRPERNQFFNLLDTPQLEEGLQELKEEIEQVKPTVIIAAGAWPMYFLTGRTNDKGDKGTGIMNWRGSVVENTLVEGGPKVFCCLHPAFLLRNWRWHVVFADDLEKAIKEKEFPEIRYPEFELLVDPDDERLLEELRSAEWLSCDLENFGKGADRTLACFGFSDALNRAIVYTTQNPALEENCEFILGGPAKKIFQYGTYDVNFMSRTNGIKTNGYYFDTYVATATLLPEFPRGLDFLTSVYTDFAYYKEERKTWKDTMDFNILWNYNAKDVIATLTIAFQQMEELRENFGWKGGPLVSNGDD